MARHPGQILRENFMEPLHLTADQVAEGLAVSHSVLEQLLSGEQRLGLEMVARLSAFFGVPARWWLQMQLAFDEASVNEHQEWQQGVTPLVLAPAILLTPKGVLHLGEPAAEAPPTTLSVKDPDALQQRTPREAKLVQYKNGAVALIGDAP